MVIDAIINFFVGLLMPLLNGLPTLPTTSLPALPPILGDFVSGFALVFGPMIIIALGWRAIAYFLPGGAG